MSVSVLIPAHNEEKWLDRTIRNIFDTAQGDIEVCVVLNGYDQEVDPRVKVLRYQENTGERVAMNTAAHMARGTHLLRIDAHCDFSPDGWDVMMEEATGEKDVTVAVLTAVDKEWNRIPGHWYGFCRLLPNMEAKWQKPNINKAIYKTIEPNMAFTGCGFMLRKDFYWEIGGADESLPKMGAIGEEFAVKAWLAGGKVQTRTDVMIGHIFDTGGYGEEGVLEARKALVEKYGDRYEEIRAKFPDFDTSEPMRPTGHKAAGVRTVIVTRTDTEETKDGNVLIRRRVRKFRYVWVETEHPEEKTWTDEQIREKYAPMGKQIDEQTFLANDKGELQAVA